MLEPDNKASDHTVPPAERVELPTDVQWRNGRTCVQATDVHGKAMYVGVSRRQLEELVVNGVDSIETLSDQNIPESGSLFRDVFSETTLRGKSAPARWRSSIPGYVMVFAISSFYAAIGIWSLPVIGGLMLVLLLAYQIRLRVLYVKRLNNLSPVDRRRIIANRLGCEYTISHYTAEPITSESIREWFSTPGQREENLPELFDSVKRLNAQEWSARQLMATSRNLDVVVQACNALGEVAEVAHDGQWRSR